MKRVLLSIALLSAAFSATAQIHVGGQFCVNFDNEHTVFSDTGESTNKEKAFLVSIKPKVYWNLNEKMQLGGRIGFAFGRLANGTVYDKEPQEKEDEQMSVRRAIGWSIAPFYGYKILDWKRISIWAEANVFFGQYYNRDKALSSMIEWDKSSEYGFQILPVINIDLTEKLALQLHLGFISLGWYGTVSNYPDKVVTTSQWNFRKGGWQGLVQGFSDYGIGIVRTF